MDTYFFLEPPVLAAEPVHLAFEPLKLVLLFQPALQRTFSVLEESPLTLAYVTSLNLLLNLNKLSSCGSLGHQGRLFGRLGNGVRVVVILILDVFFVCHLEIVVDFLVLLLINIIREKLAAHHVVSSRGRLDGLLLQPLHLEHVLRAARGRHLVRKLGICWPVSFLSKLGAK